MEFKMLLLKPLLIQNILRTLNCVLRLLNCTLSLREKCPYWKFFWSVFSRILTEHEDCGRTRTRETQNTGIFWHINDQCSSHTGKLVKVGLALSKLTLSRSHIEKNPLYRNQSIHLLCKSMDWFLYDRNLHHERVK